MVAHPPTNARDARDTGSVPGLGRSPGGGHGNPLQCSFLENPMDRGAWWAAVHGVAKSRTRPSDGHCIARAPPASGDRRNSFRFLKLTPIWGDAFWLFEATRIRVKSLQSCPTLCNPMACSPPGFSVHGILQARILEWVAMPSSRGSSWSRDQTQASCISYICRQVPYH